ncbi:hypothetical protein [Thiocapsa sp. UBA6158]|jgi:hypothetical protein|nr:hypothetical protein [Thiocapsa sp. UBA6158]
MTPETRRHTSRKTTADTEQTGLPAGSATRSAYAGTARQGQA